MSELAITTAGWNRARIQRQELGPMMHDLGHTVFNASELRMANGELTPPRPVDSPSLAEFAGVCVEFVVGAAAEAEIRDGKHQILDDFIQSNAHRHSVGRDNMLRSLTHYEDLQSVLREGIESGIVSPLQLYRVVKLAEGDPRSFKLDIDAEEAAERIVSDEFQTMLHQLASSSNGALGATSNKPYTLREEPRGGDFDMFNTFSRNNVQSNFAFDTNKTVTGFSRGYLDYKKKYDAAKRKADETLAGSGGCPVRHATYAKLGGIAQQYFEQLGTPDARPRFEGESLVARSSRFVSVALLKSLEGAQS